MPAKTDKQVHLMQMALAVKSGKRKLSSMPEGVRDKIKEIVDSMSKEKIKHFTKTNEAKEKSKYIITYNDGSTKEEELTESQKENLKNSKDWSKIKSVRNMGVVSTKKVDEDGEGAGSGEAPSTGAATLSNTVGRGSYEFGNNPQSGNSDTKKGSGEPMGGGTRKLTPEEVEMLGINTDNGEMKIMGYENFRAKSVKENFVAPEKVKEAINTHFGDFGHEAHDVISTLPVISGLIEIKGINEALSGKYKEAQIRKVIDAISDKRSS